MNGRVTKPNSSNQTNSHGTSLEHTPESRLSGNRSSSQWYSEMPAPIAAIVMVLLRYAYERYTQSEMYRDAPEGPQIVVVGDAAAPAAPVQTPIVSGSPPIGEPPGGA